MAQGAATPLPALVEACGAAWASRDPDRIVALHALNGRFALNVDGETPAIGHAAAVRAAFARILRDDPAYASTIRSADFGLDVVTLEYMICMSPPAPFVVGRRRFTPTGRDYDLPAIAVIRFKNGLVADKQTYLDTEAVHQNSRAVELVGAR